MHRVGAGDLGGGYDPRYVEITLHRLGLADAYVLVGQLDVKGFGIGLRMNGDRLYAELPAGAYYPQGDFAPCGYQNFSVHIPI